MKLILAPLGDAVFSQLLAEIAAGTIGVPSPAATHAAMTSWWLTLPTTQPSTVGTPWNDGGVLSWT